MEDLVFKGGTRKGALTFDGKLSDKTDAMTVEMEVQGPEGAEVSYLELDAAQTIRLRDHLNKLLTEFT